MVKEISAFFDRVLYQRIKNLRYLALDAEVPDLSSEIYWNVASVLTKEQQILRKIAQW